MTDVSPGNPSADGTKLCKRLHLSRECYATKQIRCNQFLSGELHLVAFSSQFGVFAPFRSKNSAKPKKKHQPGALTPAHQDFPDEASINPQKNGLH
jgi:hypothetical protein